MGGSLPSDVLRRLQLAELEILVAVDDACRALGISYFVDSGTALGARRHGGFIPWDDDIDVGMPRADYDRFLAEVPSVLAPGFSVHTYGDTPGFAGLFAKVYRDGTAFETRETREAGCPQGVFLDVFPYDELSSDAAERAGQLRCARRWQGASYLYHAKSITGASGGLARLACRVAHVLARALLSREGIERRFSEARRFRASASDELGILSCASFGPFPKAVVLPTATCSFEGREFSCPRDIDRYLEIGYGPTWRELPPEAERRTHAPLLIDFGDGTGWRAPGGGR